MATALVVFLLIAGVLIDTICQSAFVVHAKRIDHSSNIAQYSPHLHLTRSHFTKILSTAIEDEMTFQHVHHTTNNNNNENDDNNHHHSRRQLLGDDDDIWDKLMNHGWEWSKRHHHVSVHQQNQKKKKKNASGGSSDRRRNLRLSELSSTTTDTTTPQAASTRSKSPFVLCDSTLNQSGYQRKHTILQQFNFISSMAQIQTIYNTMDESCFIVTTNVNDMETYMNDQLKLLMLQQNEFDPNEDVLITTTSNSNETITDQQQEDARTSSSAVNTIKFGPLVDILKLPSGSAFNILSDHMWSPIDMLTSQSKQPPPSSNFNELLNLKRTITNEFSYDNVTEEVDVDIRKWSRSIMIDLLPTGLEREEGEEGGQQTTSTLEDLANEIVQYVKDMAQVPPPIMSNSNSNDGSSSSSSTSYLRSMTNDTSTRITTEELSIVSTREAFSLTAMHPTTTTTDDDNNGNESKEEQRSQQQQQKKNTKKRMFHQHVHSIWSTALSQGFEASHGCQVMLDTLEVRVRRSKDSPPVQEDDASTTTNTDTPDATTDEDDEKEIDSIEIILHPPSQFMKQAAVQSSAWNKHCALSLLMGLSIHPLVQTVEVGMPISLASMSMAQQGEGEQGQGHHDSNDEMYLGFDDVDGGSGGMAEEQPLVNKDEDEEQVSSTRTPDLTQSSYNNNNKVVYGVTNPQWITQSGTYNSRPFFDVGLDGTGQIVAVADGGLDIDNCYFRDEYQSNSIYGDNSNSMNEDSSWEYTSRKVVHYDDTFGDRTERSMGHGTYVGSIVAGKRSVNGIDESTGYADGTAPGSKLAFFDMEDGYLGIADPGPPRIFESLYNPKNSNNGGGDSSTKGARVINASWGRSYNGQYTSFCRQYDAMLRNTYPDLLFVVSAGNTGRAGMSSVQDPADCKNPLAVGSTLSYSTDIRDNEKGPEYLADYSSRGPAQDGRMKPDIVAPGHFVLAARSHPDIVGECDGEREPNVKSNDSGGDGVKYTTGTSMASPVLTGGAAIIRQYFAEGYCSTQSCCGYQRCTTGISPSGSLIKAILMNGAEPLRGGVQRVPSGEVLYDQPLQPYDNNQGYGRINLINSVPLNGKNRMNMKIVNDKWINNGNRDMYQLMIDRSNDCDMPLRVTLAWYDPPGSVGCKNCLMNDIDLSIQTSSGTRYPNGRTSRDSKNTVERIVTNPSHGEGVSILVDATNFATKTQKYSLAITGCFREAGASRGTNTAQPASSSSSSNTNMATTSSSSSCPNRLFEMQIDTSYGNQLSWNLIESQTNGGIETLINGSGNQNTRTYKSSVCLNSSLRYRFQLRNTNGGNIRGQYKLIYRGLVIFNSANSQSSLGKVSSFRFKTNQNGVYQPLGSNAFMPHVQLTEAAEIGVGGVDFGSGNMIMAETIHEESNRAPVEDIYDDEEGEGGETVGTIDYSLEEVEQQENIPVTEESEEEEAVEQLDDDMHEDLGSVDHFLSMDYEDNIDKNDSTDDSCSGSSPCPDTATHFCKMPAAGLCDTESEMGTCTKFGAGFYCTQDLKPVCGCDGIVYSNLCSANYQSGVNAQCALDPESTLQAGQLCGQDDCVSSAIEIEDFILGGSSRTFLAQKLPHDEDYVSIERGLDDDDEIIEYDEGDESV